VAVGRGIYGSGPQQRALDIAETQLAEAKDRLSTALQMKNLEYTGMKTVAEARKAIAETGRVPYQNMKDLAEAGAASALEVGRRMELDPTWLKQKAGIQTDEDIRKAIATHIKTIDEVGLKSFLAPFEAAGIQPTTDQVAEYKRKMEAQHQITNAFEALYQGFRNTHGGMAPGQNKILEWAEKLKEPDQVRQLMIQERGKAQAYNAFEANFRVARKTANDNLQRINQTITALEQRSPAADRAGIESELGAISRRMGQSGVQYLTGGRTALESLIATLHHYSPWPWQPEIPDVQRTQILNLFNEYRNWERQQLDVLDEGGSRANAAANAQEVRNIQNETQRNLTEVLTGSGKGKNIHLEVGPDGKLHAIGQ
jgi:hypothetical protein